MNNPTRRACLAAIGSSALINCANAQTGQRVVASFSILADMVRELVPPDFEVTELVGPNAYAHVFEPTPAAVRRLAQADLVVVNGLGFEGWLQRLVLASGYEGPVIVASRGITPRLGGHHGIDPHAWQDLTHAKRYAQTLADALATRWPQRKGELQARAAAYRRKLSELDERVRTWLDAVPHTQRRVVTSHDAFGYFGDAYGVAFLAPQGWTTSSEPSAAAVARLIRQIREQRIKALFLENISDPRLLQRIAQESGARIGGTLYSDALSDASGPAPTYLKLFEHNARTLAAALGSDRLPASSRGSS